MVKISLLQTKGFQHSFGQTMLPVAANRWFKSQNFSELVLTSSLEIVFGGPAESKGAKRAVAPGFSAQLGQENEVRNRLRETDVESGSILAHWKDA